MKSFRIKNVKSYLDSGTIEIAPLTVFVGQNSCGKSSLLRFPVVLSQSYLSSNYVPILFSGRYVDYGFFEDVVHNHDKDNFSFEYSYDVNLSDDRDFRYVTPHFEIKNVGREENNTRRVTMQINIKRIEKRTLVESSSMLIDGKKIITFGRIEEGFYVKLLYYIDEKNSFKKVNYIFELEHLHFEAGGFPFYDSGELFNSMFAYFMGEDKQEEKTSLFKKLFLIDDHIKTDLSPAEKTIVELMDCFDKISNIMSHVYRFFNDDSKNLSYIGPFRDAPSRIYRNSELDLGGRVGTHGENVSNILAKNDKKTKKIVAETSKWLEENMGYKLTIEEIGNGFFQIVLIDRKGVRSNISDVGFGVSQVLPVVLQVIREGVVKKINIDGGVPVNKSIYIEQPELHLHPAAQSKLADLFSECVCKEYGTNIVIETHSEHLIRKLQVLISDKDNALTSDMVKIYYVDKNTRGNGIVTEMKIASNGKFETEWPSGFFDQAHTLTMNLLKNNAVGKR